MRFAPGSFRTNPAQLHRFNRGGLTFRFSFEGRPPAVYPALRVGRRRARHRPSRRLTTPRRGAAS